MTTNSPTGRPSARLTETSSSISDSASLLTPALPLLRSGRQAAHARVLRSRLSGRDLQILTTLAELRLLTGRHVQRLYLHEATPATAARRTRAILRRLTDLKAVIRLDRRVGGIRAGSDGHLYGISGLGRAVLALDAQTPAGGRPLTTTKPAFQDHLLAVSELDVRLVERARAESGAVELLHFLGEPGCWRRYPGPAGITVTLKPDAFVALGVGDFERHAFIEMDCGTESQPTITRKSQRYVEYWRSGLAEQDGGVFPKVWWIAPSPARADQLVRAIRALAPDAHGLFVVALASEAATQMTAPDEAEATV